MSAFKIQYRGHCQRCGRQQAVKQGTMAHHGYTVRNGWFSGVCSGNQFEPVERSRKTLDATVAAILKSTAELRADADRIEAGQLPEKLLYSPTFRAEAVWTPVADIPAHSVRELVNLHIFRLRRRAEIGEQTAAYLTAIADTFHGKDLIEVRPEDKPEAIVPGDRRVNSVGTPIECRRVEGAKVYYVDATLPADGKRRLFKTSTRSWRALAKA